MFQFFRSASQHGLNWVSDYPSTAGNASCTRTLHLAHIIYYFAGGMVLGAGLCCTRQVAVWRGALANHTHRNMCRGRARSPHVQDLFALYPKIFQHVVGVAWGLAVRTITVLE